MSYDTDHVILWDNCKRDEPPASLLRRFHLPSLPLLLYPQGPSSSGVISETASKSPIRDSRRKKQVKSCTRTKGLCSFAVTRSHGKPGGDPEWDSVLTAEKLHRLSEPQHPASPHHQLPQWQVVSLDYLLRAKLYSERKLGVTGKRMNAAFSTAMK